MSNLFTMGAQIILNDAFTPRINTAERASRSFRESLFSLKGALTAVAGSMAIKASFDWLVKGNADMETYQNTLAIVMGSQKKAVETLAWANKFAASTPFEIPQIVEATTRMQSYGLNAQKTLGIVGDMASVMGKDLMQAVEAVADAQTGEVERLKEFGITKGMIQQQAKMLGSNPINNQGQITDQKAFNAALFSLMEKRYKGGMDLQSKTFKGMMSNVQDFVSSAGRTLGKPIFDALKSGLSSSLDWMNKLQGSGAIDAAANEVAYFGKLVGGVFATAKGNVTVMIDTVSGRFIAFYNTHKPQIAAVGQLFQKIFTDVQYAVDTYVKPALDWVRTTGLAGVTDALTTVGGGVLEVASFFNDNWSTIKPLIEGIIIAFGTYWAVTKAIRTATMLWTAAQWAVNAAMTANPIGLVILGIGLLIGAGILLYQNWDTVKQGASDMWTGIENFFKSGVNKAIGWINTLIDVANKIPGIDIGHVQALEMGQTSTQKRDAFNQLKGIDGTHANSLSSVPFDGYIAELHKGEMVLTAREADRMRQGITAGTSPGMSGVPGLPGMSKWLPGTRFSDTGRTLATSDVRNIDSAKTTKEPSRKISIGKLFDSLTIHGTKDMDEEKLANVIIDKLHDKLTGAADILGSADMGVLL